jgi:precorrin-2 dehydrogenase/sirohydrochlorin ferrochelatase
MAKPYFTLNLDVENMPCIIVGGDEEALEKSERLIEARADLTVVAKRAIPELVAFCAKHGAKLELRPWREEDIPGKFFCLNCVKTEPALSQSIYDACIREHCLISAYDQPLVSNAVMQALVRAGSMRIAIGSGGASPGLASAIRKSLEELLDSDFVQFSEWVIAMRQCMVEKGDSPKIRKHKFKALLKDFKIEGEVKYPKAYERQKSAINERGGVFYSGGASKG